VRHPFVADVRSWGFEPDAFLWLGVRHKQFGYRYVERYIDEIRSEGLEFLRKHGIVESIGEAGMCHAEKMAREDCFTLLA
jgi:predicted hydrolase (HD superfamily)